MTPHGTGSEAGRYRRLDEAFRAGDWETLQTELGSLGRFPNVVADPAMGMCLVYAIYHGPIRLVAQLLEAGADPDLDDGDGFPPVMAALSCSDSSPGTQARTDVHELVALLLAHGANVNQRGIGDLTPLHLAASQGDLRMVEALLAGGADPNEVTRIDDFQTAVEVAAEAGHAQVVKRLRPLTTRLDWKRASAAGDLAVLDRMVRSGYDIDATDGYSQTALMRCANGGRSAAVEWLIAQGANLDHTVKFHLSALMLAVLSGHEGIARTLVGAGADTTIEGTGAPGFHNKTAADLADERGDHELAAAIRAHA